MNIITRKAINSDTFIIYEVYKVLIDNNFIWSPTIELTTPYEMYKLEFNSYVLSSLKLYAVIQIHTTILDHIFRNRFNKTNILFNFIYTNNTLTIPVKTLNEKVFIIDEIVPLFNHILKLTIEVVLYFDD